MAWEKKAEDIVILDVSKLSQFANYFVIITGQIDQHSKAVADHIVRMLREQGVKPHHTEGLENLQWILIDYVDVLVNLFLPEVREFYDLESLWGEAERIPCTFKDDEK
ncbi:MAG: ribosome silencing factor [bacterium]